MRTSRWDGVALLSLLASLAVTAALYTRLPDPLPTHFDLHGNANGWMPRAVGAWGIPAFAFVLWAIVRFAPRVLPRVDQVQLPDGTASLVAMMTAVFIAAVHIVVLYVAVSPGASVIRPVFLLIGVLFVCLGLVMPRVRRNPILGIRTAWTLTSDENWARTHRVAGYSMVLGGIAAGIAGGFGGAGGGAIAIACLLFSSVVPAVYSLVIARRAS